MTHVELGWRTEDGLAIYAQAWQPEDGLKGIVCLVHGLGEHSGRYGHVAEALNRAGYVLSGFDLRGHGRSEGQRGYAPRFEAFLDDTLRFLEQEGARFPGLPCFLYGHSLGGTLVLEMGLRRSIRLDGVIATGPSLRTAFAPPAVKVALGRAMLRLWPTVAMWNEVRPEVLSRDPQVVQAYRDDPLVHDRLTPPVGIGLLEHGLWLLEHAAELRLPALLMHGGADRLTSVEASREFAAAAGERCTLRIWDGLYHEVHNEPEREQVLAAMVAWLDNQARASRREGS